MFINLDFSSTKRALRIILEKEKDEEDEDKDEEEGKRTGEEEGEEEKRKTSMGYLCIEVLKPVQWGEAVRWEERLDC